MGLILQREAMLRVGALVGFGLFTVLAACAQTAPTLGVYMEFEAAPGNTPLEIMQREVGALFQSTGISVNWRYTRENRGNETYSRLVVLRFTGACRAERASKPEEAGERIVVGDTRVLKGRVLPFSEVRCDEVRRALSYLAPAATVEQRQKALGLAMGRVVAHELYHVLAHTTEHTQRGLTQA